VIQPPQYIDTGMGSWFSKAIKKTVGWVAGKGNTPGTPNTRKLGYEPDEVAAAVARNIQNAPPVAANNQQAQMLLLGGAGAVLLVALMGGKKR